MKTIFRSVSIIVGTLASVLTILDFILNKGNFVYGKILKPITLLFFGTNTSTLATLLVFAVLIILCLLLVVFKKYFDTEHKYFIPIKEKFDRSGNIPNSAQMKKKLMFKNINYYYYIPSFVQHDYHNEDYPDLDELCGPYCAACDHVLSTDTGYDMCTAFFCVNCNKKYKIPSELLGNYGDKIMRYFVSEYSKYIKKESDK